MDPNATITTETGAIKIGKKVSININKDQNINDLDRLYDTLVHCKHMLNVYNKSTLCVSRETCFYSQLHLITS